LQPLDVRPHIGQGVLADEYICYNLGAWDCGSAPCALAGMGGISVGTLSHTQRSCNT